MLGYDQHGHLVRAVRQPAEAETAQNECCRHQRANVALNGRPIAVFTRRSVPVNNCTYLEVDNNHNDEHQSRQHETGEFLGVHSRQCRLARVEAKRQQVSVGQHADEVAEAAAGGDDPDDDDDATTATSGEQLVVVQRLRYRQVVIGAHRRQVQQRHVQADCVQRLDDDIQTSRRDAIVVRSHARVERRVEDLIERHEHGRQRDQNVRQRQADNQPEVTRDSIFNT